LDGVVMNVGAGFIPALGDHKGRPYSKQL
jgi:hypothetical protein